MLINQISEMRNSGMSDSEISRKMREQGASPLEISQAIDQLNIKSAVANEQAPPEALPDIPQEQVQEQEVQEMPIPAEYLPQQPQEQTQNYPQYQSYSSSSDSITDIAEQIAEEKTYSLRNSVKDLENEKNSMKKRIENIDLRLTKIEETIEKIQMAILGKVGSYGDSLDSIKKEMEMMQDVFSKSLSHIAKK